MQEAAARDAQAQASSGHHHQGHPQEPDAAMDMDASNPNLNMDAEQIAFLQAMQAAEMGDQANMMNDIGMMGLAGGNEDNVQSLLHMLAQQEQENQRPDEHYLTIAQNGKTNVARLSISDSRQSMCQKTHHICEY